MSRIDIDLPERVLPRLCFMAYDEEMRMEICTIEIDMPYRVIEGTTEGHDITVIEQGGRRWTKLELYGDLIMSYKERRLEYLSIMN